MKKLFTIAMTLVLALTLAACGKDKKPAQTDPAKTEPAAAEPTKTDPAAPAAGTETKPEEKKAEGGKGW